MSVFTVRHRFAAGYDRRLACPWRWSNRAATALALLLALCSATALAVPQPRIVGGTEANAGEYPWQVAIFADNFFCGGSLIEESWVVTAGHCVVDAGGEPIGPQLARVLVGEVDLTTSGLLQVDQVLLHPEYAPDTGDNDIALLHLSEPAPCTLPTCSTIDLVTPAEEPVLIVPGSTIATATGWGDTDPAPDSSEFPDTLRAVDLVVTGTEECRDRYEAVGFTREAITRNMLCAYDGGKDTCQGDSGGPLAVPTTDGTSWKLAGVTSFGVGCAPANIPGIYTRAACYTQWVAEATGGDVDPGPGGLQSCSAVIGAGPPKDDSSGGGGGGGSPLLLLVLATAGAWVRSALAGRER